MSTVYFISSNRAGADEHEANTETLSPTEERAHVVLSKPRRMFLHFSSQNLESPQRGLHYLNAFGWGKEKFVQSATLALAAQHSHPEPFFSAANFLSCLGRTSPDSCVLVPPGIRWPYRRTCGYLAVHAMSVAQSLYRHQPCLLVVVFLSYLA